MSDTIRLDVWLDVACLFKTRSEAKRACEGGKIEVLGTTQALRRIGQDAAPPTAAATDAPPKRRR